MGLPLLERKKLLAEALLPSENVKPVPFIEGKGIALLKVMKGKGFEGVMAKEKSSPYLEGKRSPYWQKFKVAEEDVFAIGGLTIGEGTRRDTFGALMLGRWKGDELVYVGNVGSGFCDRDLVETFMALRQVRNEACPFADLPSGKVLFWCQPIFECRVKYLEIASDGKLRFPVFQGLIH